MGKYKGVVLLSIVFLIGWIKAEYRYREMDSLLDEVQLKLDFTLQDTTKQVGINHRHYLFKTDPTLDNVRPWITATGAYVSVVDFDNDGWQDIYLGSTKVGTLNQLYHNNHDGTFKEIAAQVGLAEVNSKFPSTGSIFFDCDNDGDKDVVIFSSQPSLFINHEGVFQKKESGISETFTTVISAYNVIDIDRDGDLDLIFGEYFSRNIQNPPMKSDGIMPENFTDSQNYSKFRIYKNDGKCHFVQDLKHQKVFQTEGWHFDIGVFDYFDNNKMTVWIASDFGQDFVFAEQQPGRFKNISNLVNHSWLSKNGMSVDFTYLTNKNIPVAYVSNVLKRGQKMTGNMLWEMEAPTELKDTAFERGVMNCGWSWTNKFLDIDNDSYDDLVVNNGFYSRSKEKNYWYTLAVLDSSSKQHMSNFKNWPNMQHSSLAGYQQDCLFVNQHDGTFKNVAYALPFDKERQDGRGLAYIDYLNNGSLSLITANRDGITKFYTVEQKNKHNWLGLDLEGKQSNRDALGIKVIITLESGRIIKKYHYPTNGFSSQSDHRFHIGLGNESIKTITLIWPSGIIQKISPSSITMNSYNKIVEPYRE